MKKLKTLLANVLQVSEDEIKKDSSPETIESWDSFNSLILISELEKNFSLSFSTEEIISVKNVEDIMNTLKKHGIDEKMLF